MLIIKEYLESQARIDPCFKEKYDETQLDKCIEFIWDMAREKADNERSIAIKDETVFKWARDFFNDGTAALEAEKERKAEEERKKREEEDAKRKAEEKAKKKEEDAKRKAEEKAKKKEEERYEREHAMGQITIFDILGG